MLSLEELRILIIFNREWLMIDGVFNSIDAFFLDSGFNSSKVDGGPTA